VAGGVIVQTTKRSKREDVNMRLKEVMVTKAQLCLGGKFAMAGGRKPGWGERKGMDRRESRARPGSLDYRKRVLHCATARGIDVY
jgi:hypothetical protein